MIMKTEKMDLKTAQKVVRAFEDFKDVLVAYYNNRDLKSGVVQGSKDFESSVPVCVFTFYVSHDDLFVLAGL